jgi:hypothetical protein
MLLSARALTVALTDDLVGEAVTVTGAVRSAKDLCSFELISHDIMFSSHNKTAPVNLSVVKTIGRTT